MQVAVGTVAIVGECCNSAGECWGVRVVVPCIRLDAVGDAFADHHRFTVDIQHTYADGGFDMCLIVLQKRLSQQEVTTDVKVAHDKIEFDGVLINVYSRSTEFTVHLHVTARCVPDAFCLDKSIGVAVPVSFGHGFVDTRHGPAESVDAHGVAVTAVRGIPFVDNKTAGCVWYSGAVE